MKIKIQKTDAKAPRPSKATSKQTPAKTAMQMRDLALSVVEQGLKKPARPKSEAATEQNRAARDKTERNRPERSGRPAPARGGRPAKAAEPEHMPSTVRLFFALKVPPAVSGRLAEAQRKLKGNWRNVRPDQMHVTLTYMPAVPLDKVDTVKQLGTELLLGLPPLDIKLRGTGYFPNEGSPRVWFVKVEADGLDELAEKLRLGVKALGVETDDLAFKAHITLARKKGPAPRVPPQLFDLGWTATGASLYRSHLQKTGPIYEVQSTFRFLGAAAPESPPAPFPVPEATNYGLQAPQEQP